MRNWDSSRCALRFRTAEVFSDNECVDCGKYLRRWIDANIGGI